MVKVTCPSCNTPISIDENKLPMSEVSFPCPTCKSTVNVDKRTLGERGAGGAAVSKSPQPSPADEDSVVVADEDDAGHGPKVLITGTDHPALRQAARAIGYEPVFHEAAEAARDFYLQEFPPVVFLYMPQAGPPPLAEFAPLTSLTPADRRKGFFVLISDKLRTLDGNAAFLYGVNLVVAPKDLQNIRSIYRDANAFHRRLYSSLNAVLEGKSGHAVLDS